MRARQLLPLALICLLLGCVCVHQNSGTANRMEIEAHLIHQLHCQSLELKENDRRGFSGTGKNDTGGFNIEVTRYGALIKFHGVYTNQVQGSFSGSTSWSRTFNRFLGFSRSRDSAHDSLGTP